MHIPTHILSGWCVANCFNLSPRERLLAMVAASVHDLDGLGFFFGEEAYWRFHHIVGHNLLVGLLYSLAAAAISAHKLKCFLLYLGLFHLHLLMDFFGSGPLWKIHYWWPFDDRGYLTQHAWELSSWQNYLTAILLLGWTIWIARVKHVTPLELLAPRLNAKLLGKQ
ncbi:MAG TPA: hypothetical protein VGN72_07230 [Tepidisphaeraceae bacterium]|jgi:hypothetical protein|nr:hypothetical protein [Tepidisphaeraceae bacterium]